MLLGIGVDTATVSRVEKSMASPAFCKRVFGEEEYAWLCTRPAPARVRSAAAAWAAKEALAKALGTGLTGFAFAEAEVLRRESGAPYFVFTGTLAQQMQALHATVHLSLTHEGNFATAFVVIEKE